MSRNSKAQTQPTTARRLKRIAKSIKTIAPPQSILFKPIDEVIGQCVDMHKTLQRSHQMLTDFNRELRTITEYLNQVRYEDYPDTLTVWNFDSEDGDIVDHRNVFGRLDDDENCSDIDCGEEQFKNEIFGLKKPKCKSSVAAFSLPQLNSDFVSPTERADKRLRTISIGGENDS